MSLLSGSFFIGRWFGINVRVHFLLLFFAAWHIVSITNSLKASGSNALWVAPVIVIGLFLSILLHEFGHSLACKMFKGQADEIILWPLGGLALCRPPFHPTAHLITTVAGPLVTLVIWLLLDYGVPILSGAFDLRFSYGTRLIIFSLAGINLFLLKFNCLPGFPMDGGRAIRDLLWHVVGHRKATILAVWLGRITGGLMLLYALNRGDFFLGMIGFFVLQSNWNMEQVIAIDHAGESGYSLKEHFQHAKRRSEFRKQMEEASVSSLHQCLVCKRTEQSTPGLEFRVSSIDEEEYCLEHLPKRPDT